MKKKTFILILLLLIVSGYAISGTISKKCNVTGLVMDSLTGEGLPFASLQLFTNVGNEFISGTIADITGNYILNEIPLGEYRLKISFMGYLDNEVSIDLTRKKEIVNIRLSQKNLSLSEIEIKSEKNILENTIEKTTVNISKSSIKKVGTARDVIQTLPSVDIDFEGNIYYRGSDKVVILLNGEKSELVKSLDQIPADQIEKIELINNPSAKYDAEGMSGIINIVLKSGNNLNSKKTLMLVVGYPETFGGNAGLSGMKGNTSFFVNAGINHNTKFQTKEHLRKNYENPDANDYYQYDRQDENLNSAFINTSLQYLISKKQHIGLSLIGSSKFNSAIRNINYETLDENGQLLYQSTKDIDIALNNYAIDGNLSYLYDFNKNKQFLRTNFHYSLLDQTQKMDNSYYTDMTANNPELQNTSLEQLNKEATFSLDYSHPVNDSVLIETGYDYNSKDLLNNFQSESYDNNSDIWINDTSLDNRFNYIQQINAVYFSADAKLRHINIQAGIRFEYTTNSQNSENKNEYFDFFPSINISHELSSKLKVFAAYSRRINRPTIKMLNPYTDEYADILNMHIGNPNLMPEYVNSIEVGYRFVFKKVSGFGSVYYRNIDQAISRIKFASNDSALIVTFINLDNAKLLGGDFSFSYKPFDWWGINASVNLFYTNLRGEYGNNQINRSKTGWITNISNNFKLPAGFGLQVMGYYRSKLPSVMGTYQEKYYLDMALHKKILKNKGQLIFKVSDVFNTYRYGLDLDAIDDNGYSYSQRNRRKNESQYFTLSFIYNIDGKETKKKKTKYYLESFDK